MRPGKARFEYAAPSGLLIVADGSNVNVQDRRLKTFDRYPLGSTPLTLFLSRRIRLSEGVEVTRVLRLGDGFSFSPGTGNARPKDRSFSPLRGIPCA